MTRKLNIVITGALCLPAFVLLQCNQPTTIDPEPSSGGASGQGGAHRDAGLGGNGGGGDGGSSATSAVNYNLDVIPSWWGTNDAPQGPETSGTPSDDANCGNTSHETVRKPADVLLLLDGSASMDYSITEDCYCTGGTGMGATTCTTTTDCKTRLDAIKPAVTATLASSSYVNWGLKIFPTPGGTGMNNCNVSKTMEVAVSDKSAADIQKKIDTMTLTMSTPTASAITYATDYLKSLKDTNQKFILLATDGEPNCKNNSIQNVDVDGAAAAATAAKDAGFPVYVIGIGPNLSNLSTIAAAGGTKDYYPVSSPEQLVQVLSSITKTVGSCTYTVETAPPDAENVAVYVNKQRIEKSADEGWTYGNSEKEIVLTGSYCAAITAGEDTTVKILFGCPGAEPFPSFVP